MVFPKQLSYLLERDQALDGAVKLCVSQFEPWINHSHLPFFPEYTDHGLPHIQAVLTTATALIRDEAWPVLTPGDAAVLILAVLLHDCAMHLSEDGFYALLKEPRSSQTVPGMDADKPWHILWEDFYGEASRFDGRKLKKLFGDLQPARRPPENANDLTKRDRLLIGEFLRRHHPRLAQEIAHYGVPGPAGNKDPLVLIGLTKKDMAHVAAISGIVARSHGADVRAFLPYLQKHYDIRQYKNIHPVFLMTLLRVGDYVQIDSARAPAQVLQVKSLASPVSQGEWKAHQAIRDIRNTHEDPEALFIDALPEDVETFLRIEEWLKGIQSELDASWAALGEVYGRYAGLKELGIVLRRIRSSMDDLNAFSKKVAYIPKKVAFRATDADVLQLLIRPLYGDSPEIGIRELLQNALDAVREMQYYQKEIPSSQSAPLTQQEADVVIDVKVVPGKSEVIISDRGIGMTPDIAINYFLNAGASFRRSEDWRKLFEKDGKSEVLRAGRFGIGALAAFLLGPEMEITTRHVEEEQGIAFNASLEGNAIEFQRCQRPVGTTIRIKVSDDIANRLESRSANWDWYCLKSPSLIRRMRGALLPKGHHLPIPGDQLSLNSGQFRHPVYGDILWTYSDAPKFICNGLKIGNGAFYQTSYPSWTNRDYQKFKFPNLSIFDSDAALPINLQRSMLNLLEWPFENELFISIVSDFIGRVLVNGPKNLKDGLEFASELNIQPVGLPYRIANWYLVPEGFGWIDPETVGCNGQAITIALGQNTGFESLLNNWVPFPFIYSQKSASALNLESVLSSLYSDGVNEMNPRFGRTFTLDHENHKGLRVLLSTALLNELSYVNTESQKGKPFWTTLKSAWSEGDWHLLTSGACPDDHLDLKSVLKHLNLKDRRFAIGQVFTNARSVPSVFGTHWKNILGNSEIPFDPDLRRKVLAHAYKQLAPYIDRHEALKAKSALLPK